MVSPQQLLCYGIHSSFSISSMEMKWSIDRLSEHLKRLSREEKKINFELLSGISMNSAIMNEIIIPSIT